MLDRSDIRIVVGCPSAQAGKGVMVAEAGSARGVTAVLRVRRVKAEERHGGQCLALVVEFERAMVRGGKDRRGVVVRYQIIGDGDVLRSEGKGRAAVASARSRSTEIAGLR